MQACEDRELEEGKESEHAESVKRHAAPDRVVPVAVPSPAPSENVLEIENILIKLGNGTAMQRQN